MPLVMPCRAKESNMSGFTTEGNTVPKAEAMGLIKDLATEQGIRGAFKVFYDDALVSTPDSLPDQVDMDKVRVSETLDQAHSFVPLWDTRLI